MTAVTPSDKYTTIFFGNLSKHPKDYGSYSEKLRDRVSSFVDRLLSLSSSTTLLDKSLKLVDASMKLTKHVSHEAYVPAAPTHQVVKDVRGVIGMIKVPLGLWGAVTSIRNLGHLLTKSKKDVEDGKCALGARGLKPVANPARMAYNKRITTIAQQKLAILYESLSVVSGLLVSGAFLSKSFTFINSKYQSMKGKVLEFSKVFPKIFFGLHLVTVPKVITGMVLEGKTYAAAQAQMGNGGFVADLQGRRVCEITHSRNYIASALELIKTGFEFVRDGAMLSKTGNPVIDLIGVVGVAIFDFFATWTKTM